MRPAFPQRGQVLPASLAGVVLTAIILFFVFNAGNKAVERSAVVNAADAAAYSAGVFAARQLNFMAYTNRAMIANHIGVGHFVAYMSWIRYVKEVADRIEDIAQFFPVVNVIAEALEELSKAMRDLAEAEGKVFVPSVDKLNLFYTAAQTEAAVFLDARKLNNVMRTVAERFDPDIVINDPAALARLPAAARSPIQAAIRFQEREVGEFVEALKVSDRNREIVDVVEQTYGARGGAGEMSEDWLRDREFSLLFIRKKASTKHTLTDSLADWSARDRLRRVRLVRRDVTLASGRATAREFDGSYRGIRRYIGLGNETPGDQVLPILAYASKRQDGVLTNDVLGLESTADPLSGLSIVHVEHRREEQSITQKLFNVIRAEHANVYNPFWQPRVVGVDVFDINDAFDDIAVKPISDF